MSNPVFKPFEIAVLNAGKANGFALWLNAPEADDWERTERGFSFTVEAADTKNSTSTGTGCINIVPSSEAAHAALFTSLKDMFGEPSDETSEKSFVWEF